MNTTTNCNRHNFDTVGADATCTNCGITYSDLQEQRAARSAKRSKAPAGVPAWAAGVVAVNAAKERRDNREDYYRRTGR